MIIKITDAHSTNFLKIPRSIQRIQKLTINSLPTANHNYYSISLSFLFHIFFLSGIIQYIHFYVLSSSLYVVRIFLIYSPIYFLNGCLVVPDMGLGNLLPHSLL